VTESQAGKSVDKKFSVHKGKILQEKYTRIQSGRASPTSGYPLLFL